MTGSAYMTGSTYMTGSKQKAVSKVRTVLTCLPILLSPHGAVKYHSNITCYVAQCLLLFN